MSTVAAVILLHGEKHGLVYSTISSTMYNICIMGKVVSSWWLSCSLIAMSLFPFVVYQLLVWRDGIHLLEVLEEQKISVMRY